MMHMPDENLVIDFVNTVGTFLGLSQTQCLARINFNKNHFFPSDKIVIDLDVDNSKWSAAVEFY